MKYLPLVPSGVVTSTVTSPVPAGAIAVIWVSLLTVKAVAAVSPKVTAVAPEKCFPVSVTVVPPDVGPAAGEIDATFGSGGMTSQV